jgi:hypothetical protein
VEERRVAIELHDRVAVLALARGADAAAERRGHELHAVTDAERRHARIEDPRVALRRPLVRHAARAARQDDADGPARHERVDGRVERQDLRVDRQLAQAPRDELGVLRPEIQDEDGLVRHECFGRPRIDDHDAVQTAASFEDTLL